MINAITKNVEVSQICKAACVHADIAKVMFSKEECLMENASPTKCKVVATDKKQHLAITFYGNTHGLFLQIYQREQNVAIV